MKFHHFIAELQSYKNKIYTFKFNTKDFNFILEFVSDIPVNEENLFQLNIPITNKTKLIFIKDNKVISEQKLFIMGKNNTDLINSFQVETIQELIEEVLLLNSKDIFFYNNGIYLNIKQSELLIHLGLAYIDKQYSDIFAYQTLANKNALYLKIVDEIIQQDQKNTGLIHSLIKLEHTNILDENNPTFKIHLQLNKKAENMVDNQIIDELNQVFSSIFTPEYTQFFQEYFINEIMTQPFDDIHLDSLQFVKKKNVNLKHIQPMNLFKHLNKCHVHTIKSLLDMFNDNNQKNTVALVEVSDKEFCIDVNTQDLLYIKNIGLSYLSAKVYYGKGVINTIDGFPQYDYADIQVKNALPNMIDKLKKAKRNKFILTNEQNLQVVFQVDKNYIAKAIGIVT